MNKNRCKSRSHYKRHYTLDERKIFQVYCGHCTFPRAKKKLPDAVACENYVPAKTDEVFVTKEYLSKVLLDWILSLDMLPEILEIEKSKDLKK